MLTHWDPLTHIGVNKLIITSSSNGLSHGRRQAIIWANDTRLLLIVPLATNISEILMEIYTISFKKIHLKMSFPKWRRFCFGPIVSTWCDSVSPNGVLACYMMTPGLYLAYFWLFSLRSVTFSSQWRHNERDGVSNRQPHECLFKAQIKENIKAPRHWPLWGEFTGDRWIPRTNGQLREKCFHFMASSCGGDAWFSII